MPIGNSNNDSRIYLNVTKGQFKYRLAKDKEYEFANMAEGQYLYHTFAWKENKEKPTFSKWVLQIALKDDKDLMLIESTAININKEATVFFWMWASFLGSITPGQSIRVRTWQNDDNENVSVCWVEQPTENGFEALPRSAMPEDKAEKLDRAKEIITGHRGYLDPEAAKKVKGNGDEGEEEGGEEETTDSPTTDSPTKSEAPAKPKKKGSTPVAPEVDAYFNLMESLGLSGMDLRDHVAMVARCYSLVAGLTAEEGQALKSFNDVDPRAVEVLTKNIQGKVETIKAFPLVADDEWTKVPKAIREFMEAHAVSRAPTQEAPAPALESDEDPFVDE
jgi:hypothetical protein